MIARQIGDIGRHGHGADGHDRRIGNREFRPVFGNQQHAIPRRNALGAQKRRQRRHLAREFRPIQALPRLIAPEAK